MWFGRRRSISQTRAQKHARTSWNSCGCCNINGLLLTRALSLSPSLAHTRLQRIQSFTHTSTHLCRAQPENPTKKGAWRLVLFGGRTQINREPGFPGPWAVGSVVRPVCGCSLMRNGSGAEANEEAHSRDSSTRTHATQTPTTHGRTHARRAETETETGAVEKSIRAPRQHTLHPSCGAYDSRVTHSHTQSSEQTRPNGKRRARRERERVRERERGG